MMISSFCLNALVASLLVVAAPSHSSASAKRCTGTISSLGDVKNALLCTTVNINPFTVPAGSQFNLALLDGTDVNLRGDIQFGNFSWKGFLFQISGNSITFNGNGYTLDGGGPHYWDGQGSSYGATKPKMMKIRMSGIFRNTRVINSPVQAFSVSNTGPLLMTGITIDNSQGNQPNSKSSGKRAASNTDGFDCSTTSLIIENSIVYNQDDCLAINTGSNITFRNNTCYDGHGISIGSISSSATVSNIVISGNTIINSDQGLRIKTDASASGSSVKNITYSGNTGTGLKKFGLLIDQSYPDTLGSPGNGVTISNVNFTGATTTLSVVSSAIPIAINCGAGSCKDPWSFAALNTSGGKTASFYRGAPTLYGYSP